MMRQNVPMAASPSLCGLRDAIMSPDLQWNIHDASDAVFPT